MNQKRENDALLDVPEIPCSCGEPSRMQWRSNGSRRNFRCKNTGLDSHSQLVQELLVTGKTGQNFLTDRLDLARHRSKCHCWNHPNIFDDALPNSTRPGIRSAGRPVKLLLMEK